MRARVCRVEDMLLKNQIETVIDTIILGFQVFKS